jgi:ATP sulfurylase
MSDALLALLGNNPEVLDVYNRLAQLYTEARAFVTSTDANVKQVRKEQRLRSDTCYPLPLLHSVQGTS